MKLISDFSQGKMNKDIDKRYLPKGEYRDLLNGRTYGSENGEVGVLENVQGTLAMNVPQLQAGWNVIGLCSHKNLLYYIATNLEDGVTPQDGDGTWIGELNKDTDVHRYIIQDVQSPARALRLSLDKNTQIASMVVFEGLLIFCDKNNNPPYKLNIEESAADFDYYSDSEDALLIKQPPAEPTTDYDTDENVDTNLLKDESFQFAVQYEYEDGEVSAISTYSGTDATISEQTPNDGRTAALLSFDNPNVIADYTTDRFVTDSQFTTNLSGDANVFDLDMASAVPLSSGAFTAAFVTNNHAVVSYGFLNQSITFTKPATASRWESCSISNDGNVVLFGAFDPNDDFHIYKLIGETGNWKLTLVLVIPAGTAGAQSGRKTCISNKGNICYAGHETKLYKSENFGADGTWVEVLGITGDHVKSVCCSADGNTVFVMYSADNESSNIFVKKSVDRGVTWEDVYEKKIAEEPKNQKPGDIKCSYDGKHVLFSSSADTVNINGNVYISNDGGINWNIKEITESVAGLTSLLNSVAVSSSGKNMYASVEVGSGIYVYASYDFGESFNKVQTYSYNSDVFVACIDNEILSEGINNIDNDYNKVTLTYNTGDKHVKRVRLILRSTKTNALFLIKEIDKQAAGLSDNSDEDFIFFNDGSYAAIPERDTDKLYDNVPHKARTFTLTQNTLIFGGYTDGYSLTDTNGDPIQEDASITTDLQAISSSLDKSLKVNSKNTYGIVYYDDFNRSSAVLEIGQLSVPNPTGSTDLIYSPRVTINHLAPEWATKYKMVKKSPGLSYSIIDGFDNAYSIGGEIYLEITSFVDVVPQQGDILELFSEINTTDTIEPYVMATTTLNTRVKRYVDNVGGGEVALELSDGTTTTRTETTSGNAEPVPAGRYVVIEAPGIEDYNAGDVLANSSRYETSVFYIRRPRPIDDVNVFQEIPGVFDITNQFHQGNVQNQTGVQPAILTLEDFDIIWGRFPLREMYKYSGVSTLDNLGRPNAVSENFRQVDRFAGLIASEQYVDDTNFNGLSSINLSLIPYKDLDKRDGEIELIDSEDTNVEVYQKDKTSRILYRKNILTTATGQQSVTQTEDIWGEQMRSTSEYGMSHAESYTTWGNNRYFVDAKRGVVLRKGADGLTEVSSYGLLDYFHDILSTNKDSRIKAAYEPKYNNYTLSIGTDDTLSFAERTNGWETRFSYFPDKMTNDGHDLYAFKDGLLYKHNATETYNDFYGTTYDTVMEFYFNDYRDVTKLFNAIQLESDRKPYKIEFFTPNDGTEIDDTYLENREELFFSYIPASNQAGGHNHVFVGVANSDSTGDTITFDTVNRKDFKVGDTVVKNGGTLLTLGVCTDIQENSITMDQTATVTTGDIILGLDETSINGDLLRGRNIGLRVYYNTNDKLTLNSIQLDVDESKQ
jgi:hypothetical protein